MLSHTELELIDASQLQALIEEATELGLLAVESYKNAAAALFVHDVESARIAIEGERACAQSYRVLHQKSLDVLAGQLGSADGPRQIVEVQQIASEFALIARSVKHLANQALALRGTAEEHLLRVPGDAALHLLEMVRQVFIELRGSVLAYTTRDLRLARRLVVEDSELDRLFLTFKRVLEREIARNPRVAPALDRLILVGVYLEEIGNRVVAVCRTMLYTSPASST